MKKFNSLLALLIAVLMICPILAFADNTIGENITWGISEGTLTISGNGAMPDFKNESDAPWYASQKEIKQIVISDGITHIGNLAFYGCENAEKASIPSSVESIGVNAFSYTEGSVTSISSVDSKYQFSLSCDEKYLTKGQEFFVDVKLKGDLKNVNLVQTVVIFDPERISTDKDNWCDENWLKSVDETNLGYISKPLNGIVSNTARVMYISLSGKSIDEKCPLYNAGETEVTVARLKFKAIEDVDSINISCFYLKDSKVALAGADVAPACSEMQITSESVKTIKNLKIVSDSEFVGEYAISNNIAAENTEGVSYTEKEADNDEITVLLNGEKIEFDVQPILVNDRTLVPMRAIFEALNAKVDWDDENQTAFAMNETTVVAFQIDNNKMQKSTIDGISETIELDVAAMLLNDRTLVPLRAISEAFGNNVEWINETQTVVITTK